jgi:hypothetical protein
MKSRIAIGTLILVLGFLPIRSRSQVQSKTGVRPAHLESMQNMDLNISKSGLPAYLPREWGSLVTVQKTDGAGYLLFLQNDVGEIYLVRLIQNGDYLFLDTYDRGGVALVIRRNP